MQLTKRRGKGIVLNLLALLLVGSNSWIYAIPAGWAQTETAQQSGRNNQDIPESGQTLDHTVARELLEQITTAASEIQEPNQHASALVAIARSYRRLSDNATASDLLYQAMKTLDQASDASALNGILGEIKILSDEAEIAELLNQALNIGTTVEDDFSRVSILTNILVTADSMLSDKTMVDDLVDQAMAVTASRPAGETKAWELFAFAQFYASRSDSAMVATLLDQFLATVSAIEDENVNVALLLDFFSLVHSLSDADLNHAFLNQVLAVANTFQDKTHQLYISHFGITLADRLGDPAVVEELMNQSLMSVGTLPDVWSKVSVLGDIINRYAEQSEQNRSQDVLAQIFKAIDTVQMTDQRNSLFISAIKASVVSTDETVSRENLSQAMDMANKLPDGWAKAHALIAIAGGYQLFDEGTATALLNQALAMVDIQQYDYAHQETVIDFVTVTARLSDKALGQQLIEQCLTMLDQMYDKELLATLLFALSNSVTNSNSVALNNSQQNDVMVYPLLEKALAIFEIIQKKSVKTNILHNAVNYFGFVTFGNETIPDEAAATALLQQVLAYTHGFEEEIGSTVFFDTVARTVVRFSNEDHINTLLNQLLAMANQSQNPGFNANISVAIAKIYATLSDEAAAKDWLNRALTAGKAIESDGGKVATMSGMQTVIDMLSNETVAQAWLEQWLTIAKGLHQSHLKSSGLTIIGLASQHLSDEHVVRPLVRDMIEISMTLDQDIYKANALGAMANSVTTMAVGDVTN